jgi:hypothetical protein
VFAKANTIKQTRSTKQKLFAKTKHNQEKPFGPLLFKASVNVHDHVYHGAHFGVKDPFPNRRTNSLPSC